jgi:FkbM family methyltransferase
LGNAPSPDGVSNGGVTAARGGVAPEGRDHVSLLAGSRRALPQMISSIRRQAAYRLLKFTKHCPPRLRIVIPFGVNRGYWWYPRAFGPGAWSGLYEGPLQRLCRRVVRRGTVAYDVGAHVGFYSLLFSRLVGPTGRVYAFEPVETHISWLRKHLQVNRVRNVIVCPVAVGGTTRFGTMTIEAFTEGSRISESGPGSPVQIVALDDWVRRGHILPPHAIKMDIEGAETEALVGLEQTVLRSRPWFFLSTHGAPARRACLQQLKAWGYLCHDFPGDIVVGIPEHTRCVSS